MGNAFGNTGVFLIQTLFGLGIFVFMLRLLLQWIHANYFNPISQFTIKLTNPFLQPLHKVIPNRGRMDYGNLLVIFILEIIELYLLVLLRGGQHPNVLGLLVWGAGDLWNLLINIFFWGILISAVLSWFRQPGNNPMVELLHALIEPVLQPFRRFIPLVGGMDLSPLAAMIVLKVIALMTVPLLESAGMRLALS